MKIAITAIAIVGFALLVGRFVPATAATAFVAFGVRFTYLLILTAIFGTFTFRAVK